MSNILILGGGVKLITGREQNANTQKEVEGVDLEEIRKLKAEVEKLKTEVEKLARQKSHSFRKVFLYLFLYGPTFYWCYVTIPIVNWIFYFAGWPI